MKAGLPTAEPLSGTRRIPIRTEDLYRQYEQRIARWVQRLGGAKMDVEETVQEVFAVAHEHLGALKDGPVPTWLYRITEHVVHNKRRRERWRSWLATPERESEMEQVASLDPSALDRIDDGQNTALVYRVLDRMSDRYRSILILFELEGLTGVQIAELKAMKLATVWVHLYRARAQFLERFQQIQRELRKRGPPP